MESIKFFLVAITVRYWQKSVMKLLYNLNFIHSVIVNFIYIFYSTENAFRSGLDILVGTPGRIFDHIEKGNLDLSQLKWVLCCSLLLKNHSFHIILKPKQPNLHNNDSSNNDEWWQIESLYRVFSQDQKHALLSPRVLFQDCSYSFWIKIKILQPFKFTVVARN